VNSPVGRPADRFADTPSVRLKPLVSWPEEVEAGRRYLVVVDVEFDTGSSPWPYDTEEYEIGCMLEGESGLAVESVGDTTLVLHRFGGTYGPARFVTRAVGGAGSAEDSALHLTLITAGGVPFRSERLAVRMAGVAAGTTAPDIELPLAQGPEESSAPPAQEAAEQIAGTTATVLIVAEHRLMRTALLGRLIHVFRRSYGTYNEVEVVVGELPGTPWQVVVATSDWWSLPQTRKTLIRVGRRYQVPLVVAIGLDRWERRPREYGDVVVATEVMATGVGGLARSSPRLLEAAREALGSSVYFERVGSLEGDFIGSAYAVPASEHFTVCAVGDAAMDRAVEAVAAVLDAVDPDIALTLPRAPEGFVGRREERRRLLDMWEGGDSSSRADSPSRAVLLTGMPGIGKTALAVVAAHEAAARGLFHGGIHFAPWGPGAEERVRQVMSRPRYAHGHGQALFVLDDWGPETAPFLGELLAHDGCYVLVTSRRRVPLPTPARSLVLQPLPTGLARELLGDRLSRLESELESPDFGDPSSFGSDVRLAELCGGVPLALKAAARVPGRRAELLTRIDEQGGIFHVLDVLRGVFDDEYRRLAAPRAEALVLLAAAPFDSLGRETAAALLGGEDQLRHVADLVDIGLVQEYGAGRLRLQPLVSAYVRQIVLPDHPARETAAARQRLLDVCVEHTRLAVTRLGLSADARGDEAPSSRAEALAWLDGEHPNLAALVQAWTVRSDTLAPDLGAYLNWRRHFDECVACCKAVLDADGPGRHTYRLWNLLGSAQRGLGLLDEAAESHRRALALCGRFEDDRGVAQSYDALGLVRAEQGDWRGARDAYETALATLAHTTDRRAEADVLMHLGAMHVRTGQYGEAHRHLTRSADLYQQLRDRAGSTQVLVERADARCASGDATQAVDMAAQAVALFVGLDDVHGQGRAWEVQARSYERLGRVREARNTWSAAAETYLAARDPERAEQAEQRSRSLLRRDRAESRVIVTVEAAAFRSSSVYWAVHVSQGSELRVVDASTRQARVEALWERLAPPLHEALARDDVEARPVPVEFALPLKQFDLAPHLWPQSSALGSRPLGLLRPVTLRYLARTGEDTAWRDRWRALHRATVLTPWYVPLDGGPPSTVPADRIPVVCGPVGQGPGREIMSRLLAMGHCVALWATGPHGRSCGPRCRRLREEADALLARVTAVEELPDMLWHHRVEQESRQHGRQEGIQEPSPFSLLYDDPESSLPGTP
jgi:tetratricopeptide (TPR) repeat protein